MTDPKTLEVAELCTVVLVYHKAAAVSNYAATIMLKIEEVGLQGCMLECPP
jgi:hypothetical protein